MRVKVEPSGVCENKGQVQIRFCMYLDKKDYGYDLHYVQVPVIPKEGYIGKVTEMGIPVDKEDYKKWLDNLPKIWQDNPFHNHFIQTPPDITDKEIMDIAEAFLHEAYIKWASDSKIDCVNDALPFSKPVNVTLLLKSMCESKAESLKTTNLERII